mmetsp:Transcript_21095/g.54951  ORF Transcript_21095/g.54951 Transcript_21095/m.54951 type:complete len:235 (-) Transcript_21095:104-808(-)
MHSFRVLHPCLLQSLQHGGNVLRKGTLFIRGMGSVLTSQPLHPSQQLLIRLLGCLAHLHHLCEYKPHIHGRCRRGCRRRGLPHRNHWHTLRGAQSGIMHIPHLHGPRRCCCSLICSHRVTTLIRLWSSVAKTHDLLWSPRLHWKLFTVKVPAVLFDRACVVEAQLLVDWQASRRQQHVSSVEESLFHAALGRWTDEGYGARRRKAGEPRIPTYALLPLLRPAVAVGEVPRNRAS